MTHTSHLYHRSLEQQTTRKPDRYLKKKLFISPQDHTPYKDAKNPTIRKHGPQNIIISYIVGNNSYSYEKLKKSEFERYNHT